MKRGWQDAAEVRHENLFPEFCQSSECSSAKPEGDRQEVVQLDVHEKWDGKSCEMHLETS